jgi:hypothetical protein
MVSVATSGTMIAALMATVCATIDTRTVYFWLPPILTNGSANMLSATAASFAMRERASSSSEDWTPQMAGWS